MRLFGQWLFDRRETVMPAVMAPTTRNESIVSASHDRSAAP